MAAHPLPRHRRDQPMETNPGRRPGRERWPEIIMRPHPQRGHSHRWRQASGGYQSKLKAGTTPTGAIMAGQLH